MFWMRNKENSFPIYTLIWGPVYRSLDYVPCAQSQSLTLCMLGNFYDVVDILSVLIWVQTACKGYQLTTKVSARKERVNDSPLYHQRLPSQQDPFFSEFLYQSLLIVTCKQKGKAHCSRQHFTKTMFSCRGKKA